MGKVLLNLGIEVAQLGQEIQADAVAAVAPIAVGGVLPNGEPVILAKLGRFRSQPIQQRPHQVHTGR